MKVALISIYSFDDYIKYGKENSWSTPRGIYDAIVSDGRISEVKWFPILREDLSFGFRELKQQYNTGEFVPDIIFYMSFCYNPDGYWNKTIFPNSKLVVDCGDEPQTMHYNQVRVQNSDLILTPDYDCYLEYKNRGLNAVFTAHWADTNIFYPEKTETQYDVVTTMYGDRGDIVPYLQEQLDNSFILKTGLVNKENGDFYRNAKIVFQKSRNDEITRRLFEGMACKKLVIADRISSSKKLETIFKEDEEIVLYSSKEEALDKIRYYLNNPEEREKIAQKGYEKVIKYFTTKNIVDVIIEEKHYLS